MRYFYLFCKSIGLSVLCVSGLLLVVGFLMPESIYDKYGVENIMRIIIFDVFVFCFFGIWLGYIFKKIKSLMFLIIIIPIFIIFSNISLVDIFNFIFIATLSGAIGFLLSKN